MYMYYDYVIDVRNDSIMYKCILFNNHIDMYTCK